MGDSHVKRTDWEVVVPSTIVEMQFHHKACIKLKNECTHDHYKKTRMVAGLISAISKDQSERLGAVKELAADPELEQKFEKAVEDEKKEAASVKKLESFLAEVICPEKRRKCRKILRQKRAKLRTLTEHTEKLGLAKRFSLA